MHTHGLVVALVVHQPGPDHHLEEVSEPCYLLFANEIKLHAKFQVFFAFPWLR